MSQHVAHRHSDEIAMLKAEIERLKARLQLAQRWAAEAADALQPSAEEGVRLRAENNLAYNRLAEADAEIGRLRIALAKPGSPAAAEIERLKAALREVVSALDTLGIDGWSEAPHLMRVCRAALEGKS